MLFKVYAACFYVEREKGRSELLTFANARRLSFNIFLFSFMMSLVFQKIQRLFCLAAVFFFLFFFAFFTASCRNDQGLSPDGGIDGSSIDGSAQECGLGLKAYKSACIPIFDECGPNQIPILGGGCKSVGPPSSCPETWRRVDEGWCEPILPKEKCGKGMMEVLGHDTCRPIRECSKISIYPDDPTKDRTLSVNQHYAGNDSDGTPFRPYRTINEALTKASDGWHILVAPGDYQEDLVLENRIKLEGLCPKQVVISGKDYFSDETILVIADGVEIRGIAISGKAKGIVVASGKTILQQISVEHCGYFGMEIRSGAEVLLQDSKVVGNGGEGISIAEAKVTIERSVVQDTQPLSAMQAGILGNGISIEGVNALASITIRDSLIELQSLPH
jgi:hypothetical protein